MDLNDKGYGRPGTGLVLDLVYNPGGGFLPPSQAELEQSYKVLSMRSHCCHSRFVSTPCSLLPPRASLGLLNTLQAELMEHFGIEFSNLFTMTNMPIKRYNQHASQTTRTTHHLQSSHRVSVLFPASGLPTF